MKPATLLNRREARRAAGRRGSGIVESAAALAVLTGFSAVCAHLTQGALILSRRNAVEALAEAELARQSARLRSAPMEWIDTLPVKGNGFHSETVSAGRLAGGTEVAAEVRINRESASRLLLFDRASGQDYIPDDGTVDLNVTVRFRFMERWHVKWNRVIRTL